METRRRPEPVQLASCDRQSGPQCLDKSDVSTILYDRASFVLSAWHGPFLVVTLRKLLCDDLGRPPVVDRNGCCD